MRGTTNRNDRGSSYDRAARRRFLLRTFNPELGPRRCRCAFCRCVLTERTITVDRVVPGCEGGRYTRDNIRPACSACNAEHGSALGVRRRAA